MSDKPIPPHAKPLHRLEGSKATKLRHICSPRYMIPLALVLILGVIGIVLFLQPLSKGSGNSTLQDLASLKNQSADLNHRVNQLETAITKPAAPTIDPEFLKDLETRITTAFQQIEDIKNQPKAESPQQLQRSQAFEKDLNRLTEAQKIFKSIILFWRLKTKVLSEAPYRAELTDFKSTIKDSEDLSLLEKYADEGLQVLKEQTKRSEPPLFGNSTDSWWDRLKTMASSFVKIEKIGSPSVETSPASLDHRTIEEILTQIDEALIQQLTTISLTPSPLLGDAL